MSTGSCSRAAGTASKRQGAWSAPLDNCYYTCFHGWDAFNRGDAIFTATGWHNEYCPFTCTKVDMYKANTSTFQDCLHVPNGFYSPANDNNIYPCTSSIDVPTEFQIFTSRGGGADECTVAPKLQTFLSSYDTAITAPLTADSTIETWVHWNSTMQGGEIALVGVTSRWNLRLQLDESFASLAIADAVLNRISRTNATLPWLITTRWHHVAAVISPTNASSCFFLDGLRIGCSPFSNLSNIEPIYGDTPTFFIGGVNGMLTSGFPSGFLHGMMDEVRIHQRALPADELGYHQTDHRLAVACGHGHEACNGTCVASCLGDAVFDHSTCSCACADGTSYDASSGRCRPSCGGTSSPTIEDECGCDSMSFKVWRGRYLGIASPSNAADYTNHCWGCVVGGVGLAEIHLYDAQLNEISIPQRACWEYGSGPTNAPNDCTALFDGAASTGLGLNYLSSGQGRMRVVLDLGAEYDLSRVELFNYNEVALTSHGAKHLDLYLYPGDNVPNESSLFDSRRKILDSVEITMAEGSGASTSTIFDDRTMTNPFSAGLSCASCIEGSSGSTWPRSSVHDCACLGTHYKEYRHEHGRCLPRDVALPLPVSSPTAGVVAVGEVLSVQADPLHPLSSETTVHYTFTSQPSTQPSGVEVTETSPVLGTQLLNFSEPAHLYTLRAISSHRMHLPSDEYTPFFHTKQKLGTPVIDTPGGIGHVYALQVTVSVTIPVPAQPVDSGAIELRYTMDGSSVSMASSLFPMLGLTIHANATLRVRAFHPLYYDSEEDNAFFFVELASRSAPVLPSRCSLILHVKCPPERKYSSADPARASSTTRSRVAYSPTAHRLVTGSRTHNL